MTENNENFTFNVEDIFEEIPGDPDNCMMKLPPEVLKLAGWNEGDAINIEVVDGNLVMTKK